MIDVPIYCGRLILSITSDCVKARKKMSDKFGMSLVQDAQGIATSSEDGLYYGIFFTEKEMTHGIVAHEIFHIAHRILHERGLLFSIDHQEAHAYLCEWITDFVYKQVKEWKIKL